MPALVQRKIVLRGLPFDLTEAELAAALESAGWAPPALQTLYLWPGKERRGGQREPARAYVLVKQAADLSRALEALDGMPLVSAACAEPLRCSAAVAPSQMLTPNAREALAGTIEDDLHYQTFVADMESFSSVTPGSGGSDDEDDGPPALQAFMVAERRARARRGGRGGGGRGTKGGGRGTGGGGRRTGGGRGGKGKGAKGKGRSK